jgi:hydroxymethylglutaryl-CoA synthase
MSAFVPPYRVSLEAWCGWTGNSWEKTRAVVGHSFRIPGPEHSLYTMAANAVLKLIDDHQVDPQRVGFLAVGTESGTDNATSAAVVVRGLVDEALAARGQPPLARDIEAPEIKQACLGGVYGVKSALRYLALDGRDRQAIVVAADIAEYALGSSGEPTQGAGAVAMLLEANPRLLEIDLAGAANASAYRALDFRKPFLRYCNQQPGRDGRPRDFPVFNGKYSTACYVDATLSSLNNFFVKRGEGRAEFIRRLGAVFMHRPYHRMPMAAWTLGYLFALAADGGAGHAELARYCAASGVELEDVLAEVRSSPDLTRRALSGDLVDEPYPLTARLVKAFKDSENYRPVIDDKMCLGSSVTKELGNLYCASLPAWLAAGLEEAAAKGADLEDREILLIGYGSGDASEVLPARVAPGWREAAARIQMRAALHEAVDLAQSQYEALHEGREAEALQEPRSSGFIVHRIGESDTPQFQDRGVEYYRLSA